MILEIEIRNWMKYNPRSDVKSCSWFRMSNDFFSDPDFYGCSIEARVLWVYLLSIASKKMSSIVKINTDMVLDTLKIVPELLEKALEELEETSSITVLSSNVKSTRSDSIVRKMLPSATNERTNERTDNVATSCEVVAPVEKFNPSSWLAPEKNLPEIQPQDFRNPKESAQAPLFEIEPAQLEEEIELSDLARNTITAINTICGKDFRPVPGNMKHINARIKEGYTFKDFTKVLHHKQGQWGNDPRFRKFLRPETIFGTKFDSYLAEASDERLSEIEEDRLIAEFMPGFSA